PKIRYSKSFEEGPSKARCHHQRQKDRRGGSLPDHNSRSDCAGWGDARSDEKRKQSHQCPRPKEPPKGSGPLKTPSLQSEETGPGTKPSPSKRRQNLQRP